MKIKSLIVLILIALCDYQILYAQSESIKIENFSNKDGLTSSGVNGVYKDTKGIIWLCTNNGVFRYDGYSFKNINAIANGYLKYETFCIKEDNKKNFWIGSAGMGLFYYNTHTGRLFNLKLSEGNDSKINEIVFFRNKILLATNKGLLLCDEIDNIDVNTYLQVKVLLPDPLHKNSQVNVINAIHTSENSKSIWVGTNSTLHELDLNTLNFTLIDSKRQQSIRWLSKYSQNKLLASSWDGGVFVVNQETSTMENDEYIDQINKIVGDKRVKCAIMDKKNRCWVGTFGEGLYIFGKSDDGTYWNKNFRNNETQSLKIKANFIEEIFLDATGIAWISMAQAGLSKIFYQQNNFHYFNFPESLDKNNNKEILNVKISSDKSKLWINFNRNEIDLFDTKSHTYKQFTDKSKELQLQNDKVTHVYQDKRGNLWIVYSKIGLYVVPANDAIALVNGKLTNTIIPIDANSLFTWDPRQNSYITCFYEDSKNRLWVGKWAETNVISFKDSFPFSKNSEQLLSNTDITLVYTEDQRENYGFTISPVNDIVELDKNRYWLGTRDGGIVEIMEVADLKFEGKNISLNDEIPSNNIKCFHIDKKNALWIGTNSGLCYLYENSLKVLNTKNGLFSESIHNIAADRDRNVWVSTSYGISKITPNDLSVQNFFNSDDENLNQFINRASAVTLNGDLWFSTSESLVMFNSDSIKVDQISAPIYFTDVKINNTTIIPKEEYRGIQIIEYDLNESKTISVPYGSTLHIEFAALDYLNTDRIFYKYRIGKNGEWIMLSPGQRSLNLPNINPGEYTLSIMLANSQNNKEIRSIKIDFMPPFWRSNTAYLIYAMVVLLLLLTYRRLTIQKIVQKSLVEKERYERKKIEELDKMKSEFFSNISHEFRTPLSLIINPLEKLLNEQDITSKNKDKIRLILKSSNRLLKLTNELMDFSKIEKDLLKPDFLLCEIVSITHDVCQLFNNLADSMNIEYKVSYSFERFEIPIDKGMIEKAIFNLLSNAFKYTPLHGIIFVNLTKVTETEKEFVKISVVNTGQGISKEHLNNVFDRYFQVNNIHNKNIEGTGIGLALVKNFVELHNGRVEVKSEPNLETCFDIYLPATQEQFNSTDDSVVSFRKETQKSVILTYDSSNLKKSKPASNYRVLVVEDEDDIRNYICDELSSEYKIQSAKNGEEGLKIANETIPDLIVTDVMMPVLSGTQLCKTLKNQVITSHIPIIALSAKTTISQQIEGLEMGADVYMIKPFSLDYLKAQISRLLNFKQAVYSRYLKENTLLPQENMTNKLDDEFMQRVMAFIDKNLTDSDLSVDQLAHCVSLSKVQTYRKVKAISGLSIVEFIRTVRLKKAAQLIVEGSLNFSEIAFDTGFSTPSYFTKCFHDHFGKTPSEFAKDFSDKKSLS